MHNCKSSLILGTLVLESHSVDLLLAISLKNETHNSVLFFAGQVILKYIFKITNVFMKILNSVIFPQKAHFYLL